MVSLMQNNPRPDQWSAPTSGAVLVWPRSRSMSLMINNTQGCHWWSGWWCFWRYLSWCNTHCCLTVWCRILTILLQLDDEAKVLLLIVRETIFSKLFLTWSGNTSSHPTDRSEGAAELSPILKTVFRSSEQTPDEATSLWCVLRQCQSLLSAPGPGHLRLRHWPLIAGLSWEVAVRSDSSVGGARPGVSPVISPPASVVSSVVWISYSVGGHSSMTTILCSTVTALVTAVASVHLRRVDEETGTWH